VKDLTVRVSELKFRVWGIGLQFGVYSPGFMV
jgi:hypothetical protein